MLLQCSAQYMALSKFVKASIILEKIYSEEIKE